MPHTIALTSMLHCRYGLNETVLADMNKTANARMSALQGSEDGYVIFDPSRQAIQGSGLPPTSASFKVCQLNPYSCLSSSICIVKHESMERKKSDHWVCCTTTFSSRFGIANSDTNQSASSHP